MFACYRPRLACGNQQIKYYWKITNFSIIWKYHKNPFFFSLDVRIFSVLRTEFRRSTEPMVGLRFSCRRCMFEFSPGVKHNWKISQFLIWYLAAIFSPLTSWSWLTHPPCVFDFFQNVHVNFGAPQLEGHMSFLIWVWICPLSVGGWNTISGTVLSD